MAIGDLRYHEAGGIYLSVAIKADDGTYVDFNTLFPSADVDYYQCLLKWPTITVQTEEEGRISTCQSDVLIMDNAPRFALNGTVLVAGNDYGFWDLPLPVVIRGKTFTAWAGKLIRLSAKFYNANGTLLETDTLATLQIEDVRRVGNEARVKVVGLQSSLIGAPVDDIKSGSEWFRSMPVGMLMKTIIKRKAPQIATDTVLDSEIIDVGPISSVRASSWGSMPGPSASGFAPSSQWIARCFAPDASNMDWLWVGFECPGANTTSGGAIGRFDFSTGRWTIIYALTSPLLDTMFPISLFVDSTNVWAMVYSEWSPTDFAQSPFVVRLLTMTRAGSGPEAIGGLNPYWPCRDTIRSGSLWTTTRKFGIIQAGTDWKWWGEPIMLPFQQCFTPLFPFITEGLTDGSAFIHYQLRADFVVDEYPNRQFVHPPFLPSANGHYSGACNTSADAAVRYCMTNHRTPPLILRDGTDNYFTWVALNPDPAMLRFDIYQKKMVNPDEAITYRKLTNLGSTANQLWYRQVTAFAFWPGTNGVRKFLVAEIEWTDGYANDTSIRWSKVRLVGADATGASASNATLTAIWDHTATSYQDAPVIVHLWTPAALTGGVGKKKNWTVAVLFNRGDVSGPCYGLGVVRGDTLTWVTRFPATNYAYGPVSSMPFAGFVEDPTTDQVVHFIDQATGQAWSMFVNDLDDFSVNFSLDNESRPIEEREFACSAPYGSMHPVPTDLSPRMFWGMAPGVSGDIKVPWYLMAGWNASELRQQPGVFPLVMLANRVADAVPVADFSGVKDAWEAIKKLGQRAPTYQILIDASGTFRFVERDSGTPDYTLKPVGMLGFVDPEDDRIGYDEGAERYLATKEIENAIDLVPWGPTPQDAPSPEVILSAGSTFAGKFLTDVSKATRSIRVMISCVNGGDVNLIESGSWGSLGCLFRYERLGEQSHVYLQAAAAAWQTAIYVSGLTSRGVSIYSGEQQVRAGDSICVMDGNWLTIQSLARSSQDAVRIGLSGQVGVAAGAWSSVTIRPKNGTLASDDPAGVTTVGSGAIDAVSTQLPVVDPGRLRTAMILKIANTGLITGFEYLRVVGVGMTTITVDRGLFGTTAAAHDAGTPIQAYVGIQRLGDMVAVGDTGIMFGLQGPAEQDETAATRTISPGDGVAVQSFGMKLGPLNQALVRIVNSSSIGAHGLREAPKIDENPFIDTISALQVGEARIADRAEARMIVSGLVCPLVPGLDITSAVNLADKRIIPDGSSQPFSIMGIQYNLSDRTMRLTIRSQSPIAGAGMQQLISAGAGPAITPGEEGFDL